MDPTMLELPPANTVDQDAEARRISSEPAEGYVLEPWSGLYLETDFAYKNRLALRELA